MKNKQVIFQDWGLIDYKQGWDRQEALFAETVNEKIAIRNKEVGLADGSGHTYDNCVASET
ncbi:MAG: hypothetical protein ABIN13_11180, partial [Mucilaginibacter sp.]